jgi:hypothetical protein
MYTVYNVKDVGTPGNFSDAKVWDTTAPKEHFDFRVAVDGTDLNDWENVVISTNLEYTEKPAGQELHKYPYLQKQDWTVEISTYDYAGVLDDLETESASLIEFECDVDYIDNAGTTVLEFTNMKIQPDSVNIKEVPEKGMKLYTFTLEIGGNSVVALEADD